MKTAVQIQFHGMEASAAIQQKALDHVGRLEKIAADIVACRVVVDLEQKHRHQGRPYGVRIDLTLPQAELVVNKIEDEDVYVALRDAFQAIRRQLEEIVDQRHGHRSPRNKVRYKNGEIFE